jgi:hypothetical protein
VASDVQSAAIGIAATGDVVPAVAGKRIQVLGFFIANSVATAQAITFKSGAAGAGLTGAMALPSSIGGGTPIYSGDHAMPLFFTDIGAALNLNLSAATAVAGWVTFRYV